MLTLQFVISSSTNPFENVAVENYLLQKDAPDTVTLYLWKNKRTVVIGQNQNPYAECNLDLLMQDGGFLMRRRTGGGAVYHDDGNINFSFIAPHSLYDQNKQFSVIQKALAQYGLKTELSGRNDILCDGRKFSGNAFCKGKSQHLHHGTILIKGNVEDLSRYLKVKPAKLQKHGVKSVQSRVVNLSELADVTSVNIVPHLKSSFEQVYGQSSVTLDYETLIKLPEVQQLTAEFASEEWRLGKWKFFDAQYSAQFEWGGVELSVQVDQQCHKIIDVQIATDALNTNLVDDVKSLLIGADTLVAPTTNDVQLKDILTLIY